MPTLRKRLLKRKAKHYKTLIRMRRKSTTNRKRATNRKMATKRKKMRGGEASANHNVPRG